MACKPEPVVDLDLESGAIVTAVLHPADQGDAMDLPGIVGDSKL